MRVNNQSKWILLLVLISSCKVYKQDIMLRPGDDFVSLQPVIESTYRNYRLLPNDYLTLEVYTNKGEAAIDPNQELRSRQNQNGQFQQDRIQYLIQADSTVKFPIIGKKKIAGFTLDEAEKILEQSYNSFYKESFVKLKVVNRRVVVLGATGGQVVPLNNENTTLLEVIAIYGGVNFGSKANNVRIIRGDLKKPEVYVVDLSSIEGMRNSIVTIESGDIIYIEPWRRPWLDSVKDVAPVFNILTSFIAFVVLISSL